MESNYLKFLPLLLLLFFCATGHSQNDCTEALVICGNANYQGLTATGIGIQELNNTNTCSSIENNSLWLELPIKSGGTLGFTLIPGNPSIVVDFDFFIFGPNVACGNIGQAIRCSTTNPQAAGSASNYTGMNAVETDTAEGPGVLGNNFVKWLTVQAGETYYLVIDRPIGSSDFSIDWTGTAEFHDIPEFNAALDLDQVKCDADSVDDQSTVFDLTINNALLKTNQADVVLSFHENLNDAIVGSNPIANPKAYTNTSTPQTIYVRLTNKITGCYNTGSFLIKVVDTLIAGRPEALSLCDKEGTGFRQFDLSLNTQLVQNNQPDTEVTYYSSLEDATNKTNAIGGSYQNSKPYEKQKIWARLDAIGPCIGHDIVMFTINVVAMPDIDFRVEVVDFEHEGNSITIKMNNPENYEFSIDQRFYSDNSTFTDIAVGLHTVHIRDKKGCKKMSKEVLVLDYPRFFTPNADGINDVWRISCLFLIPDAQVIIFDRYGKMVSLKNGWDGTYNGKRLPSTEYWFLLKLPNRNIRGHFSLIR